MNNYLDYNLITFSATPNHFISSYSVAPSAKISNLTIINSKHANIVLSRMDTVRIQDIFIQNNSLNSKKITNALLVVNLAHQVIINNIKVKDNTGPILHFQEVLFQEISNSYFENVWNSRSLPENLQAQIRISKTSENNGLNQAKHVGTNIKNVSLNVI